MKLSNVKNIGYVETLHAFHSGEENIIPYMAFILKRVTKDPFWVDVYQRTQDLEGLITFHACMLSACKFSDYRPEWVLDKGSEYIADRISKCDTIDDIFTCLEDIQKEHQGKEVEKDG